MSVKQQYMPVSVERNFSSRDSFKETSVSNSLETETAEASAFQKVLLKANGTVTAMIEAYLSEQIRVVKLSEEVTKTDVGLPSISRSTEENVIVRKVLLQGETSYRNFIYAESLILLDNLEKRFSDALLNTKIQICKLWASKRVKTFKEIMFSGKEPARELAKHFCIQAEETLFSRTYSVSSQGKVTMIITEKFPEKGFLKMSTAV